MSEIQIASRLKLDFRSGLPIYAQIMEQIKQMVVTGALKPGDQLPTVRALAEELRINFNTVARSYRMLDEAGVISTQHGRGTFILERPPTQALAKLRQQSLSALTRRFLREATQLGASPNDAHQELREQIKRLKENDDLSDHD